MKKIGIVGTGETVGIAHFHAQGIQRDGRAKVSAVYDLKRENAERFVSAHGLDAVVCESYQQLLSLCDAVVICTPNAFHVPYVLEALRADKALLVEKPLSISLKDCDPILETLKTHAPFHMVGFVYRYAAQMQKLREIVQNELGQVYTYSASFGGKRLSDPTLPLEWRMRRETSGSGALGDFGSHLIDNAYFAAGLRFTSMTAKTSVFVGERPADAKGRTLVENDDAAVMVAAAQNRALASFTVSRVGMDALSVLVTGEGGLVRMSLSENGKLYFSPKAKNGGYNGEILTVDSAPQTYFDGWFEGEDTAFIDGLYAKLGEYPDLYHGYYVEQLLAMAEESAQKAGEGLA